jgi:branched-chain amino acid transport system substrate-binding protein
LGAGVIGNTVQGSKTSKPTIPVGLVFSLTGSYRTVGEELLNGALLAIEEVNDNPSVGFKFLPKIENPGGDLNEYRLRCEDLLRNEAVQHVVGCYTSSSRKEVIPVFEKMDGLLWYPSHYEGFESCNNVIYTARVWRPRLLPRLELHLGVGKQPHHAGDHHHL